MEEFTNTRVTNPRESWSEERRAAWSKAMAAARKSKRTKRARKGTVHSVRRHRNPIDWRDLAIQGAGALVGAYTGWAMTGFIGDNLIEKFPPTIKGIGYAGAGFGLLAAGYAIRPNAPKLPVVSAIVAASVPLWLRMFATFNLLPAGATTFLSQGVTTALPGAPAGAGLFRRLLSPRMPIRRLPAAGTLQRGASPGMRGSFGNSVSPGVRTGRQLI